MQLSLIFLAGIVTAQGYAPIKNGVNGASLVRSSNTTNQTLNSDEAAYIQRRLAKTPAALKAYFGNLAPIIYSGNLSTAAPIIGISISGGGNRAALFGSGCLNALDGRNVTSVKAGTGGLLQAASYLSALSGGSWASTSYIFNDMPPVYDMVLGTGNQSGWNLAFDLFTPSKNATLQASFLTNVYSALTAKSMAGFDVTFGDWWARVLSHHFLPGTTAANFFDNTTDNHGATIKFSDAVKVPSYLSAMLPFPIFVANVVSPSTKDVPTFLMSAIPVINIVYEMSPLEFGSFDPSLSKFIPMAALGSAAVDGNITGPAVSGFDSASFITGISSNLFNLYNVSKNAVWTNNQSAVYIATARINSTYAIQNGAAELDTSNVPNPFQATTGQFQDRNQTVLTLIDGGLNSEVDSIEPLIVPARALDLILIVDGTAGSAFKTPTGDSLLGTVQRTIALPNNTLFLPPLPTINTTYLVQGLVYRPTFFGCKGTPAKLNGTKSASPYPFMVFLPNSDNGASITNTSTGQIQYNDTQSLAFLDATFNIATRGYPLANGTADPNWSICLACTTVERVRGREGVDRTAACSTCFDRYCWNEVESAANATGGYTSTGQIIATNSTSTGISSTGTVGNATKGTASSGEKAVSVSLLAFMGLALLAQRSDSRASEM